MYSYARVRPPLSRDSLTQLASIGALRTTGENPARLSASMDFTGTQAQLTIGDDGSTILLEAAGPDTLERAQDELSSHLNSAGSQRPLAWSAPIRPATLDDDAALLQLDRRSWSDASGFPSLHAHVAASFFSEGGKTPDGLLVAEHHSQIVGMVKLRPKSRFPESAHVLSVLNLVVAPEARRQGIGSALLAAVEHVALTKGARKLSLGVLASNLNAIELYTRHGYVVEGTHSGEVLINGTYIDDLTLAKTIAA